jgi:hypothetical protein
MTKILEVLKKRETEWERRKKGDRNNAFHSSEPCNSIKKT